MLTGCGMKFTLFFTRRRMQSTGAAIRLALAEFEKLPEGFVGIALGGRVG
jgi:hypothetical protein